MTERAADPTPEALKAARKALAPWVTHNEQDEIALCPRPRRLRPSRRREGAGAGVADRVARSKALAGDR